MVADVKAQPKLGAPWRTLSETFPDDYVAMMTELRAASSLPSEEAKLAGFRAMRRLAVAKRQLLMRAPDADLAKYLAAEERAGRAMRTDNAESCVAMFKGEVDRVVSLNDASMAAMAG